MTTSITDLGFDIADGAPKNVLSVELQNGLSPVLKARLADVVHRVSRSIAGINFGLQDEVPAGEFDKRVIGTFLGGCLEFSVFLLGVQQLFFHDQKLLGQQEQTLSILNKLVGDLRNSQSELVGIAHAYGCGTNVETGLGASEKGANEREIHREQSNG